MSETLTGLLRKAWTEGTPGQLSLDLEARHQCGEPNTLPAEGTANDGGQKNLLRPNRTDNWKQSDSDSGQFKSDLAEGGGGGTPPTPPHPSSTNSKPNFEPL